ncbi:membrane protein, partial [Mycobacterium marinum]
STGSTGRSPGRRSAGGSRTRTGWPAGTRWSGTGRPGTCTRWPGTCTRWPGTGTRRTGAGWACSHPHTQRAGSRRTGTHPGPLTTWLAAGP